MSLLSSFKYRSPFRSPKYFVPCPQRTKTQCFSLWKYDFFYSRGFWIFLCVWKFLLLLCFVLVTLLRKKKKKIGKLHISLVSIIDVYFRCQFLNDTQQIEAKKKNNQKSVQKFSYQMSFQLNRKVSVDNYNLHIIHNIHRILCFW